MPVIPEARYSTRNHYTAFSYPNRIGEVPDCPDAFIRDRSQLYPSPVTGSLPEDSLRRTDPIAGNSTLYDAARALYNRVFEKKSDEDIYGRRIARVHGVLAEGRKPTVECVSDKLGLTDVRVHSDTLTSGKLRLLNGPARLQLKISGDQRLHIDVFDPSTLGHGPCAGGVLTTRDLHWLLDVLHKAADRLGRASGESVRQPRLALKSFERGTVAFEAEHPREVFQAWCPIEYYWSHTYPQRFNQGKVSKSLSAHC